VKGKGGLKKGERRKNEEHINTKNLFINFYLFYKKILKIILFFLKSFSK